MDTIRLGMTELQVSPLAFGTAHAYGFGAVTDGGLVRDTGLSWLRREVEDSPGAALGIEADLLPYVQEHGTGVLPKRTRQQLVCERPIDEHSDVAIVGSRRAAHAETSAGALELDPGPEDLAEIDGVMAGTAPVAGPSLEPV